eukprot:2274482-Prymnesium_polylepis.1
MGLHEAIQYGWCCDYRVVLPTVTDLTTDESMPIDVMDVAKADRLGCAAVFTVQGMHHDGARRCIAYAETVAEAQHAAKLIGDACASLGVESWTRVVTGATPAADRSKAYTDFLEGPTAIDATAEGLHGDAAAVKGQRPLMRFLVAVRLLDQCIDLPACDSVAILQPPETHSDECSANRAVQRLGRATRPKGANTKASVYLFSDRDSPWLHRFLDALGEIDRDLITRVCVRSSNPATAYEKTIHAAEEVELQQTLARYE